LTTRKAAFIAVMWSVYIWVTW